MEMAISPNGYTDDYGPNVANILVHGSRKIVGRIPAQVRAQLRSAVKDGVLGHVAKDGLLPEMFFHPAHKNSAMEVRQREAAYAVDCIASVMTSPADVRDGIEQMGGDVLTYALNEH